MQPVTGNGRSQSFPFPTRFARLRQGPVAYFDAGSGEAVIFVHGLAGDFTHFEHVAAPLAARHRVLGLDMPGCGISCKPTDRVSIAGYARTLLDWMTHVGIQRATLVGHSAGGLVCSRAALMAPDRVQKLVLLNSAGLRRYPQPLHWIARGIMRPWLLGATLEHLATPMLDFVFVAKNEYTEKFMADQLNRPAWPTAGHIAKVFHDLTPDLLDPAVLDNAHRFRMPVLIVWGDEDRLIPPEGISEVAERLRGATFRVLPGCGHMPMIERPSEVIAALGAFLKPAAQREMAA